MSHEGSPLLEKKTSKLGAVKRIAIAGVGFFSDAYDLFIINIVMVIMGKLDTLSKEYQSAISSAALWGAVGGQLFFGLIADRIGRKKGFICTLSLVIVGALASAGSFKTKETSIFLSLTIFRLILGIGIGGEYPLSATITAESSETESRGRMTSAVFSMQYVTEQGVGALVASIMGFVLLKTLGEDHMNIVWRLCLGFGAVPGLISLYFRITMEETEHFKKKSPPKYKLIVKKYWKTLIGTAGCWFLLDVVFYANGLFSSTIIQTLKKGNHLDGFDSLVETSKYNIYLTLIALPGYWTGIFLIDLKFFGRKNTQIIGFALLGAIYIILGALYTRLIEQTWLFIFLYGLTFFFTNAGPNMTTFVIPSEAFPTEVRATCHGISAASGAVIGSAAMAPILNGPGLRVVFYTCGGVALLGALFSILFTKETKGISLQNIQAEDENEEKKESSDQSCHILGLPNPILEIIITFVKEDVTASKTEIMNLRVTCKLIRNIVDAKFIRKALRFAGGIANISGNIDVQSYQKLILNMEHYELKKVTSKEIQIAQKFTNLVSLHFENKIGLDFDVLVNLIEKFCDPSKLLELRVVKRSIIFAKEPKWDLMKLSNITNLDIPYSLENLQSLPSTLLSLSLSPSMYHLESLGNFQPLDFTKFSSLKCLKFACDRYAPFRPVLLPTQIQTLHIFAKSENIEQIDNLTCLAYLHIITPEFGQPMKQNNIKFPKSLQVLVISDYAKYPTSAQHVHFSLVECERLSALRLPYLIRTNLPDSLSSLFIDNIQATELPLLSDIVRASKIRNLGLGSIQGTSNNHLQFLAVLELFYLQTITSISFFVKLTQSVPSSTKIYFTDGTLRNEKIKAVKVVNVQKFLLKKFQVKTDCCPIFSSTNKNE